MIAYFSGTGSTRLVAMMLSELLDHDTVIFMPHVRPDGISPDMTGSSFGIVVPVYAWGIPPIVIDWIRNLSESFVKSLTDRRVTVWCVLTCGDETGMAHVMLKNALRKKGLKADAIWSVQTPNVYVLLPGFDVDAPEVSAAKIEAIRPRIDEIAEILRTPGALSVEDVHTGPMARLKTAIVYPLFRRWGIHTSRWHSDNKCIGCGRCTKVCPVGNVALKNGNPEWGERCTSCLACYHVCPVHSVAYGDKTARKGQFFMDVRDVDGHVTGVVTEREPSL